MVCKFAVHPQIRIVQRGPVKAVRDGFQRFMVQLKGDEFVSQAVKHAVVESVRPSGFCDGDRNKAVFPVKQEESAVCGIGDGKRLSVPGFILPFGIVVGVPGIDGHIPQHPFCRIAELIGDAGRSVPRKQRAVVLEGSAGVNVSPAVVIFKRFVPGSQLTDPRRLIKALFVRRRRKCTKAVQIVLPADSVYFIRHGLRRGSVRTVFVHEVYRLLRIIRISAVLLIVGEPLLERLPLCAVAQAFHTEHRNAEKLSGSHVSKSDQPGCPGGANQQG